MEDKTSRLGNEPNFRLDMLLEHKHAVFELNDNSITSEFSRL